MRKLFYRHATVYTISSLLTRGIAVLLVPLYTRFLSPRAYGLLDLVMATCNLVNLTIALEIHQAIARFYHEWTPFQRRRYVSTATIFAVAVYTVVSLAFLFLGGPVLERIAGTPLEPGVVGATAALMWTGGLFTMLQSQLRWSVKVNDYVTASILFSLVAAVVTPALLLWRRAGLLDMLLGLVAANCAGVVFAAWRSRENYIVYFSRPRLGKMLGFSAPLVLSSLAVFATLYADRFIILAWLSVDDLGLFSLATKFASVAGIALVGVNAALTPLVYQHHRDPGTRVQLEALLEKFVLLSAAIVLGALWFSEEVVRVLTTGPFLAAGVLVPPLVLASLLNGLYNFFPGLFIARRTRTVAAINVAAVVVNVPVTSALVALLGIVGAPLGAVVVAAFVAALYFHLGRADYDVAMARRILWGAAAILAASWALRALVPAGVTTGHVAAKAAGSAAGLGALYLLGRARRPGRPTAAA